jgi:hypothetical protein
MNNIISLLLIALIVLAMSGCVEDKPPARLDSPNRNERIDAIREAQNKYGRAVPPPTVSEPADTPFSVITVPQISSGEPSAGDRQAIVGHWYSGSTETNLSLLCAPCLSVPCLDIYG